MHENPPVTSDSLAISLRNVRKIYKLYSSMSDQALDIMGLTPLLFWRRSSSKEFVALDGLSLDIVHGERVGIVGRNGAGKTTLLKLISGNFSSSEGSIEVNGKIQALMQVGLGFHPEFTGYDNLHASLLYNGLQGEEYNEAMKNIIDFVELGDFLNQPLKTYSLGMRSRLQFAAATAIKPDILIVDEVLGAGDAYFSAKSAARMKNLTSSGCTLILVSHSTPQILQFCSRVVWIERGRVVMDGEALEVVKRYEEFNQRLGSAQLASLSASVGEGNTRRSQEQCILSQVISGDCEDAKEVVGPIADGGVSRWGGGVPGIRITKIELIGEDCHPTTKFRTGEPMTVKFYVVATEKGVFPCFFNIVIFSEGGAMLTRNISKRIDLDLNDGDVGAVKLLYD